MTKREQIEADVQRDVLEALDNGVVPWRQPWGNVGGPRSIDGRPYRSWNIFRLLLAGMSKGYSDPRWGTFAALRRAAAAQAKREGREIVEETVKTKYGTKTEYFEIIDGEKAFFRGGVRKGEKGTHIVLSKRVPKKKTSDDDEPGSYWLLTYYVVFNAEQADGVPEFVAPVSYEHEHIEAAEEIIDNYADGPELRYYHGDEAVYYPQLDCVDIPKLSQFERADGYYSTVFHELVHSTGHESRLGREIHNEPGSPAYAKEELVAEFGAAILTGLAGIQNQQRIEQSAAYIAHWRERIDADPKLVYKAASTAQQAVDRILSKTWDDEKGSRESGSQEPAEAVAVAA